MMFLTLTRRILATPVAPQGWGRREYCNAAIANALQHAKILGSTSSPASFGRFARGRRSATLRSDQSLTRHDLRGCVAGLSVHPAAHDNGPPWRDNDRTDNGTSNHHGAARDGGDAACAIDAARADHGTCFHRAQGDEASGQQQRDHQMFHDCSPRVEVLVRQSQFNSGSFGG
jgi:hypothetical protein